MSEENQETEKTTPPNGEETENSKGELVNERLLAESKKNKERYQTAQAQLNEFLKEKEERDAKKLEADKNYQELLRVEREKSKKASDEALGLKKQVIHERIKADIRAKAPDARDFNYIESLINLDNLDPETGIVADLSTQIDVIKKDKLWAFKTKAKPSANIPAGYTPGGEKKPIAKMSNLELGRGIAEQLNSKLI